MNRYTASRALRERLCARDFRLTPDPGPSTDHDLHVAGPALEYGPQLGAEVVVEQRANLREVRAQPKAPFAAHQVHGQPVGDGPRVAVVCYQLAEGLASREGGRGGLEHADHLHGL